MIFVYSVVVCSIICRIFFSFNLPGIFKQGRTKDGLGMMLGVNHIGHFLLTNLLLDRLKACQPSRVINVSSAAHSFGSIDFDILSAHKALGVDTSNTGTFRAYSDSKLCNVLFTHELAKRLEGTNVTCYSLHPGESHSQEKNYQIVPLFVTGPVPSGLCQLYP